MRGGRDGAAAGARAATRATGAARVTLVVLLPVCALATALTPMGFGLWSYIGASMSLSKATGINEWQPAYPTGPVEIGFWVLAVAFVALLDLAPAPPRARRSGAIWSRSPPRS